VQLASLAEVARDDVYTVFRAGAHTSSTIMPNAGDQRSLAKEPTDPVGIKRMPAYHLSTIYRTGNDGIGQDSGHGARGNTSQNGAFGELPEKDSNLH
jgi:hypothetical protein